MISKKALKILAIQCAMNCHKPFEEECSNECVVKQAFNQMSKELEVLEIFKKYLNVEKIQENMTNEDFNKVKEWLNEDNK